MRWMYFAFLIVFASCSVPQAIPEKNPTIVIALDEITPSDSAFFAAFGEKKGVTIELRQLSAEEILTEFQQSMYGTEIDLIFMHHLYDLRKLKQAGVFQKVRKHKVPNKAKLSGSNLFFSIGLDPFICVTRTSSSKAINIYDDLASSSYINLLSNTSKAHFYAPFEERMNRGRSYERISSLTKTEVPFNNRINDSVSALLTTQSEYRRNLNDSTFIKFTTVHHPNSMTSGVFHDILTLGIVKQGSHHEICLELLDWIMKPENNKRFNSFRHYDSFLENDEYQRYSGSPTALIQYHTMIERILGQLE